MKINNCVLFCNFGDDQLEKSPSHEEAKKNRDLIQPTEVQISQAKDAVDMQDYSNAIELLTPAIEVSLEILCVYYS